MRTIFGDVQAALLERERHRENAGRFASQYYLFETTGTGELVTTEPLMFDTPFFYKPFFAYGHELITPADREVWLLPLCSGGVYQWEMDPDERKWYIGAYMYFRVTNDRHLGKFSAEVPAPVLHHHFMFTHDSYKVLSEDVNDALQYPAPAHLPPMSTDNSGGD